MRGWCSGPTQIVDANKQIDPTALVTIGFLVPQQPNATRYGDERVIQPYPAIAGSKADFINLLVYPFVGDISVPQIMENFGSPAISLTSR